MAPYTIESSQPTIDHFNKHFPTIYIVSQQHILRDLYHEYYSFWFILCQQIFSDAIARGVVADRKVGANFMRWRESGGVSFKTFKTEKQKKGSFAFKHSWFRENIWLNATNSAFSKSLHNNVGGQKHFLKRSMCPPPLFAPCSCLG
jgi:hypothetical protein